MPTPAAGGVLAEAGEAFARGVERVGTEVHLFESIRDNSVCNGPDPSLNPESLKPDSLLEASGRAIASLFDWAFRISTRDKDRNHRNLALGGTCWN